MSNNSTNQPLNDHYRQNNPLPGEVDLKYVKVKVFMAAEKIKNRFKVRK